MKYCSKCGSQLADGVAFCPNCGTKVDAPAQPTYQSAQPTYQSQPTYQYQPQPTYQTAQPATNGVAIAALIFAFFFNLVGLILGCVGLSKSKELNGAGRGMSIAAIVISIISMVIGLIVSIIYIAAIAAGAVAYMS